MAALSPPQLLDAGGRSVGGWLLLACAAGAPGGCPSVGLEGERLGLRERRRVDLGHPHIAAALQNLPIQAPGLKLFWGSVRGLGGGMGGRVVGRAWRAGFEWYRLGVRFSTLLMYSAAGTASSCGAPGPAPRFAEQRFSP
eukprot:CAMPEP_0206402190 /NCGR_PEP_ID=MMETSP0294-20121207/26804_1 /ASSEMBLY_ACC=CAM_ASM_000327 /TAXON_ID=39354 /ORGANISM="Heterosigma akashiwo, Strain CCMP2393" /LENGTH=139 /DNA_ID=CAMNT_0053859207 /DNA_START=296 /DNA_END=712 /DNA_ORIENTATION=-